MRIYQYEIWYKNGGYVKNTGNEVLIRWIECQFSASLLEHFKVIYSHSEKEVYNEGV